MIRKTATIPDNYKQPLICFPNARTAFCFVLEHLKTVGYSSILLPSYIGYSSREGSGIFDPVVSSGIEYSFYRLNSNLQIDIDNIKHLLDKNPKQIVLLVHYFGHVDRNIEGIVAVCRDYDAVVIEDAAHALYTDFIDHKCGIWSDYTIYSIHKMLPILGGMLRLNSHELNEIERDAKLDLLDIFQYNLYDISKVRKKNAKYWDRLIRGSEVSGNIKPLFEFREDITYQTYPVIVKNDKRDSLYFGLNEAGFGAVSLYHELIRPIDKDEFPDSFWLSEHILNLPVHQDTATDDIKEMFSVMKKIMLEM